MDKGLEYASRLGATHAILTGKAEPTQEAPDYLCSLVGRSRDYVSLVDMHTNGYLLQPGQIKQSLLKNLTNRGLTMVTFSIAHYNIRKNKDLMGIVVDYPKLVKEAVDLGLCVRCSLVLCRSGIGTMESVMDYIRMMGELGVHMVVIRELWVPKVRCEVNKKVYRFNIENKIPLYGIENAFKDAATLGKGHLDTLDPLPWGAAVYAMEGCFSDKEHGVNITFAKCEENAKGPVLKSIVHKPNGHGYRNWDSNANILY